MSSSQGGVSHTIQNGKKEFIVAEKARLIRLCSEQPDIFSYHGEDLILEGYQAYVVEQW
jgi:hypothetical protein